MIAKQVMVTALALLILPFGCTRDTGTVEDKPPVIQVNIQVTPPLSLVNNSYGGMPVLSYPDSSLKRVQGVFFPQGIYVICLGKTLYFIVADRPQDNTLSEYRKQKRVDQLLKAAFPVVFGTPEQPNRMAIRTLSTLTFRAELSDEGLIGATPVNVLEYPVQVTDTLFLGMRPF